MWSFIIQGPWNILSCQKWSLNEFLGELHKRSLKFVKITKMVLGYLKSEKMEFWSLFYWSLARLVLMSTLEKLHIQSLMFGQITKVVLVL